MLLVVSRAWNGASQHKLLHLNIVDLDTGVCNPWNAEELESQHAISQSSLSETSWFGNLQPF